MLTPVACATVGQQLPAEPETAEFVYRVDLDGSSPRRPTEGNHYVEFRLSSQDAHGSTDGPRISPDGRHIAYTAVNRNVPNVCVMGSTALAGASLRSEKRRAAGYVGAPTARGSPSCPLRVGTRSSSWSRRKGASPESSPI